MTTCCARTTTSTTSSTTPTTRVAFRLPDLRSHAKESEAVRRSRRGAQPRRRAGRRVTCTSGPLHTPGPHAGHAGLRRQRRAGLHRRHAVPAYRRWYARSGSHDIRGDPALDHGGADETTPEMSVHPGHTEPTSIGRGVGTQPVHQDVERVRDREGEQRCTAFGAAGDPSSASAQDYDGGTKCWVRFDEGNKLDIVPVPRSRSLERIVLSCCKRMVYGSHWRESSEPRSGSHDISLNHDIS